MKFMFFFRQPVVCKSLWNTLQMFIFSRSAFDVGRSMFILFGKLSKTHSLTGHARANKFVHATPEPSYCICSSGFTATSINARPMLVRLELGSI